MPLIKPTLTSFERKRMSISILPKELRLQIWALTYFSQAPRLITIATCPHDENHGENTSCPRYSPSPAPIAVNICQEARTEAHYQAFRAGHIVTLSSELENSASSPFYFRFDTDLLFLPLEGACVKHYDDSPESGLLAHFRQATGCTPTSLRNLAFTNVITSGLHDGSLSNVLREFSNITRLIMVITDDVYYDTRKRATFLRAARRIVLLYNFDLGKKLCDRDESLASVPFTTEIARLNSRTELQILPEGVWWEWISDEESLPYGDNI